MLLVAAAAFGTQLPPTTRRGQSPACDADDDGWLTQLRPAWLAHEANWPAASARRKAAWKRLCSAAPFPWADPTSTVYASAAPEVCETFHEAREALDYSYHDRPLVARQRLQDDILLAALNEKATPLPGERPWIVFTAGAMGVGKSHALLSLHAEGIFPLDSFQNVDPDKLKGELPEFAGYLLYDRPSAATKLHRESSLMAEVLFEHSLRQGRNILVDGSLRDSRWYARLFRRIKKQFPEFRLAILHVAAPADVVLRRVAERAAASPNGRAVPTALVEESLRQVPASVRRLAPLVDFVGRVSNDDDGLKLVSGGATWGEFARVWGRELSSEAPHASCDNLSCDRLRERSLLRGAMRLWGRPYGATCARCIAHGWIESGQVCACYATRPGWSVSGFKMVEETSVGFSLLWALGWYDTPPKNGPTGKLDKGRLVSEATGP